MECSTGLIPGTICSQRAGAAAALGKQLQQISWSLQFLQAESLCKSSNIYHQTTRISGDWLVHFKALILKGLVSIEELNYV